MAQTAIPMRWSQLLIPTLRESPGTDGDPLSQRLLLRAGYLRSRNPAGTVLYLPLAQRSIRKLHAIIQQEMESIAAQELRFPLLQSANADPHSFRLAAPWIDTIASLTPGELRSYKQLPQRWYQIQPHFRNEPGQGRESLTLTACSLDRDANARADSYEQVRNAFRRTFERCDLLGDHLLLADNAPDSSEAQQFLFLNEHGATSVIRNANGTYAANAEMAVAHPTPATIDDPAGDDLAPAEFHTPGRKTIADVADFTGLPATSQMKSLVLIADGNPYLVLVRGDHALSEAKFARVTQTKTIRPAQADEIRKHFNADAGSLGPVGIQKNIPILADLALRNRRNMIAGANRNDYHLRNVTPGRDFEADFHDLRQITVEDLDVATGSPLTKHQAIELASLTSLRTSDVNVLNDQGVAAPVSIATYSLTLESVFAAVIETHHDADGLTLPPGVAPFEVVITPVSITDAALRDTAQSLYDECRAAGLDTLLDDRDERPGVKFKDADLIGIPYRLTIGSKKLAQGLIEAVERSPKQTLDLPAAEAVAWLRNRLSRQ